MLDGGMTGWLAEGYRRELVATSEDVASADGSLSLWTI